MENDIKYKRVRTFFAFLPITINSKTKWLETITVEENFIPSHVSPIGEYFPAYWKKIKFI